MTRSVPARQVGRVTATECPCEQLRGIGARGQGREHSREPGVDERGRPLRRFVTEPEVDVYATEYARTQFTGALQGYRVRRGSDPKSLAEMRTFSGRTIDVPSMFISGRSDWGVYQTPGAVDRMQASACTRMVGFHLVDGAGHWVQQEQPERVSTLLIQFLRDQKSKNGKP